MKKYFLTIIILIFPIVLQATEFIQFSEFEIVQSKIKYSLLENKIEDQKQFASNSDEIRYTDGSSAVKSTNYKSPGKAFEMSLLVPGWGQYYSGQKERALVFSLTAVGFGIGAVIADGDFRKKRDDYDRAKLDLANAVSADEINRLRDLVITNNREAYDAETTRNMLVIVTAGVYVYNILDALVFFPDKKLIFQGTVPTDKPKIEADFDGDRVGLKLTASF